MPATEVQRTVEELARTALELLRQRLPPTWSVDAEPELHTTAATRPHGLLIVRSPDGRSTTLVLETKRSVNGRDVDSLVRQVQKYVADTGAGGAVVIAPYLSPPVRTALVERGLSYLDATGNLRVQVDTLGLFIGDRGAESDPRRGPGRPRGTLKGGPAARIVRALADFSPSEWTISQLIDVAEVSTGAGYRVLDYLDREGLVERPGRGRILLKSWKHLLQRWSTDYDFFTDATVSTWIAPRGLGDVQNRLAATDPQKYAVTGSIASAEWAPYAPARNAMIYSRDPQALAEACDLRQVDAGANVLLAEPQTDVPFARTAVSASRDITIAAPAQVYVDLARGPGRNPSEAEALLEWMAANEQSWRR